MSINKLEFKITKDSTENDVELDSMSLEAAQAFAILIESLTKIAALTPNSNDIKIQIKQGSAAVVIEGNKIETIDNNFYEVINNNSVNKGLVEQWRRIQTLFLNNGLHYEANFYKGNEKTSVIEILKNTKKIRRKPVANPAIKTNVSLLKGKLIAVGGKIPNIHVELEEKERITISCTEENAKKAKTYLYSEILISVWVKEKKQNTNYELCDSYFKAEIFNEFKLFIDNFKDSRDEVESLMLLHYECRKYLDAQDYGNFRKFIRLFNHQSVDVNILNTILIISQPFIDNERLKEILKNIKDIFDRNIRTDKNENRNILDC